MPDTRLPTDAAQLHVLLERASAVATSSKLVLCALRDVEERHGKVTPAKLCGLSPSGWGVVHLGLPTTVNDDLQGLAASAVPLLDYLALRPHDQASLRRLASLGGAEPRAVGTQPGSGGSELLLDGLLEVVEVDGAVEPCDDPPAVAQANRLRVGALIPLIEHVADAASALCRRVRDTLHPPSVRERVRVDLEGRTVTVDQDTFHVPNQDALTFLDLLADADGGVVSGPQVAAALGVGEFKVKRVTKQLPRELAKMVKTGDHKGLKRRGSWLVLPPLP